MSRSRRALGQRLAAAVPALMLGMAAGIAGGAYAAVAMDATPYGETDLNTISRQSQQAGSQQGWQEAQQEAAQQAARLKASHTDRVDRLEGELTKANRSIKDLKKQAGEQDEKLIRARSSLAETTAALENATSQPSTGTEGGQEIEGILKSTWVFRSKDKPWPRDCAEPLQTYRVRVTAGAGATVAEARLVRAEARQTQRGKGNKTVLSLTCSMTYTAALPTPLGDGYKVSVLDSSKGETPVASKAAASTALSNGSGPTLAVTR